MLPENIRKLLAEDDERFDNWLIERAKVVKLQDARFLNRMDKRFDQLSEIRSGIRWAIATTILMGIFDAIAWTVTVHHGL